MFAFKKLHSNMDVDSLAYIDYLKVVIADMLWACAVNGLNSLNLHLQFMTKNKSISTKS